jgi:RNA polymerase sigma factor (sigma-70 family)
MATASLKSMNRMVGRLKRAALLGEQKVQSDGRLLESFVAGRDEAAFEMLVKRHGPMVLGVCRRVIGNLHDAQDAFQAVFLVLARKAAAIVPRELVGNWLHGVAFRTALQARAKLCRRRARELQVMDMPHPTVSNNFDLLDLHQALDRELCKLPDKYRVPIVLCDLEGRSRKEVTGQLQIPEGTLSSRLATGRQLLAKRLARHGLALSGGALATVLSQQAAAAAMPSALLSVTVQAAALTAAGESAGALLSTQVLALSQGVLKTMFLSKIKVITVLVLGVLLGGVGAGFIKLPGGAGDQAVQAAQPAPQAKPQPEEPIDGILLLNQQIQQELRLSKNQIDKLTAVAHSADQKNGPRKKEIEHLQKQIEELQRQIARINDSMAKIQGNIDGDRKKAVGQAAPDILSARAQKRVREIQRQHRGLRNLLLDPKVQAMLKINDEQFKKIESILKKSQAAQTARVFLGARLDRNDHLLNLYVQEKKLNAIYWAVPKLQTLKEGYWEVPNLHTLNEIRATYSPLVPQQLLAANAIYDFYDPGQDLVTLRQLFEVLTDRQKTSLLHWVGEPYQSPSWQELWNSVK